jgi:hypothetical protein
LGQRASTPCLFSEAVPGHTSPRPFGERSSRERRVRGAKGTSEGGWRASGMTPFPDLALRQAQGEVPLRWARSRGEVFSNTLMVRCERIEPRTMSQVHRPLWRGGIEGGGGQRLRLRTDAIWRGFPWPRWIPACAGMTPRTRCSWCPNRSATTVIPGLDPGIQPTSPPARGAAWWMAGSRRATPTRLPPPSPQGGGRCAAPRPPCS